MGRTKRIRKRKAIFKETDKNVSGNGPTVELLRWMKANDQWRPNCILQLTEFAPSGLRGLMAKQDINISDILVRIPLKLLVTKSVAVSFIEEYIFQNQLALLKELTTHELLVIFLLIMSEHYDL